MNPDPDTKTCCACHRTLHFRHFAQTGQWNKATGRRYGDRMCRDCRRDQRRAAGIKERRPRLRPDGWIWCPRGRHYLPLAAFSLHSCPARKGRPHAYCRTCENQIRKERRFREESDPARYAASLAYRSGKRRKDRQAEQMERRRFVANAITTLGRRGCTQSMIARLFDTTPATIGEWARRSRLPVPNAAARFALLLRETAHLPEGPEPVRRIKPFAGFEELVARVRPKVLVFPIRSRWRTFEGQAS